MSGEHVIVMIYRASSKAELAHILRDQARQLEDWSGPVMRTAMKGEAFGTSLYMDRHYNDSRSVTAALSEAKLKINQIGKVP